MVPMITRRDLENLGDQLRDLGHRRRELAGRVFEEAESGDLASSQSSYRQLDEVTGQAVSLMQRQLQELGGRVGEAAVGGTGTRERAHAEVRHTNPGDGQATGDGSGRLD